MSTTAWKMVLTGTDHARLKAHLFPGDGLEAAAVVLCSYSENHLGKKLCCREIMLIPHNECIRSLSAITWPRTQLDNALSKSTRENLVPVLMHSHPQGSWEFSSIDDQSDQQTIPFIQDELHHEICGSAIMCPDGAILARMFVGEQPSAIVDRVQIVGADIQWFLSNRLTNKVIPYTSQMTKVLNSLTACVIGASGTGSIVCEQLGRLGFKTIIVIDPDVIETRNLNRILASDLDDAQNKTPKPAVVARSLKAYRTDVQIVQISKCASDVEAILCAAQADVLFCCVDSAKGRLISDRISEYFLLPLIDMGVSIPVTGLCGEEELADVVGRIDYVHPRSASLKDRGVYDQQTLRAENLRTSSVAQYEQEVNEGYISGMIEEAPSVISLNMQAASMAVNEFLARSFPIRFDPNDKFARTLFSLSAMENEHFADNDLGNRSGQTALALGAAPPLLGIPSIEDNRRKLGL